FLNKGLTITLIDKRVSEEELEAEALAEQAEKESAAIAEAAEGAGGESAEESTAKPAKARAEKKVYHFPNGLLAYVEFLNMPKTLTHPSILGFEAGGDGYEVEIAMQWNTGYKESVHTFANTINTIEGGTHEEGFRSALTSLMNRYAREHKLLKEKETNLTGDDCREGLSAVISVRVSEPQFEGQTKTKLGNTEIKSFVQRMANEHIGHWLEANPAEAKVIINKAVGSAQARLAARKARDLVRRKSCTDL